MTVQTVPKIACGCDPIDCSCHADARTPHAVVIGAGFGGLAAAVRLLARGYRVTVLERRDMAGGRAYVFEQNGFTFDAGPTVITAPFLLEELWSLAGRNFHDEIDLRPVNPFYRIRFDDGETVDYCGDAAAMRAEVMRLCPEDADGYERFLEHSRRMFKTGFEELGHVPFGRMRDMLKVTPDLLRMGGLRSVYALVSKYIRDERLRVLLSFQTLLVGGNPFNTSAVYTLIPYLERKWGAHFAMGGTGRLVQGIVSLIEGMGGNIRYNTEVAEIVLSGRTAKGVRLKNGTTIPADIVVSNGDAAWTYRHLVDKRARRSWPDWRIDKSQFSMSLFVWYFGTRRRYEDVAHHSILLGPRYRDLLKDIFAKKILPSDFSLYLHRPTATDPSLAPDGCDTFYVLSPVAHLDSGINWGQMAEPYRQRIEAFLEKTILPDLKANVIASHMITPQYFHDDLLSLKGAAFSFAPVLWQSAWFRPHNKSEDIDNLFLVGAGTHPGAGLPGVLSSARVLDTVAPDPEAFLTAAGQDSEAVAHA